MAMLRPMQDLLYRYRKHRRRSIDGIIPGTEYSRVKKFTTPPLGFVPGNAGYNQDLYMWGLPRDYHPNIHAPHVDWTNYEQYPIDVPPPKGNVHPSHPFEPPESMIEHPGAFVVPQDDLSLSEQFLRNTGASPRFNEGPIPGSMEEIRPFLDGVRTTIHSQDKFEAQPVPRLEDIAHALDILEQSLPEDHPDIVHLRQALQIMSGNFHSSPETGVSDNPAHDIASPIDNTIVQDSLIGVDDGLLQSQMAETEEFGQTDSIPDESGSLEQILHEPMPELEAGPALEPMTSETCNEPMDQNNIQPGGYDIPTAASEIEQAIDQVMGTSQPQELDPWQMQYDTFAIGMHYFDQQMQYMAPPFMNPGTMGPMGPIPGPGR